MSVLKIAFQILYAFTMAVLISALIRLSPL